MSRLTWYAAGFGTATALALAAAVRMVAKHDEELKRDYPKPTMVQAERWPEREVNEDDLLRWGNGRGRRT